jgi:hypothetical protein
MVFQMVHVMAAHSTLTAAVFRKARRITITLPQSAFLALQDRSDHEGRSLSNLAAYLLESSLDRPENQRLYGRAVG